MQFKKLSREFFGLKSINEYEGVENFALGFGSSGSCDYGRIF
jgi:hypothetical protein